MSSGEDDLGEIQAWNSKNSSINDSGAICGSGQHQKTADNQQQQWTYIAVTPSSEESIPIHTSSFKSVVSNLLPPGSAVNGENDFDPSLTELNAILEGKKHQPVTKKQIPNDFCCFSKEKRPGLSLSFLNCGM